MKAVLKSNDPVLLHYAEALLKDAQIACVRFDEHMSMTDGSLGILPRRLMVADEDFARAEAVLRDGLKAQPAELPAEP